MKRWERYSRTPAHQRTRDRLARELRDLRRLPTHRSLRRFALNGLVVALLMFLAYRFMMDRDVSESVGVGVLYGVGMTLFLPMYRWHKRELARKYRKALYQHERVAAHDGATRRILADSQFRVLND